jgi:hypothetical protein
LARFLDSRPSVGAEPAVGPAVLKAELPLETPFVSLEGKALD